MADALKFMIEFIDKVTRPASNAARAVGKLDAQLLKLKATVGEVAALGKISLPSFGGGGGGGRARGTEKQQDAHVRARIAHEKATARAAEKAAAAKQKLLDKQAAARARHDEQTLRAAERMAEKEKKLAARSADRARASAVRESQKQLAQVARANELQARATQKAQAKTIKDAAKAQKAVAGTGRSMASIAKADKAHEFVTEFASSLGLIVHPATLAAAAVALLAAGFVSLLSGAANMALAASEAKNDTLDMLEAMLGSRDAALRTNQALEDVTRNTAVSQQAVRTMAQELTAAGVTNEAMLLDAVKAISQTESVLKGAGAKIQNIVEKAAATGKFQISTKQLVGTGVQLSVLYAELAKRTGKGVAQIEKELKDGKISAEDGIAALTKVLDTKFGAVAAKQAKDFGAQMQRAKDNISRLFEDVDTGPFLDALAQILSVFDQSTASGQALHQIVTTVFDGLFKAATAVLPYVETLLLGIVLITLKLWNAFRPVAAAIAKAFGSEAEGKALTFADAMLLVANTIGFVARGIAAVLENKVMIDGIVASVQLFAFAVKTLATMFGLVILGVGAVLSAGALLQVWLVSLTAKAHEAATNFISGLVQGLASGAGKVVGAVRNLGESAVSTFKSFFGMRSPSRLMAGLGENLTQGLSMGVDRGAKAANDNMANVVDLQAVRARGEQPTNAATSQGGAGRSVTIEVNFSEGAIQINGSNMSVAEVRELFPEVLVDAIERALLSQGGGEKVA